MNIYPGYTGPYLQQKTTSVHEMLCTNHSELLNIHTEWPAFLWYMYKGRTSTVYNGAAWSHFMSTIYHVGQCYSHVPYLASLTLAADRWGIYQLTGIIIKEIDRKIGNRPNHDLSAMFGSLAVITVLHDDAFKLVLVTRCVLAIYRNRRILYERGHGHLRVGILTMAIGMYLLGANIRPSRRIHGHFLWHVCTKLAIYCFASSATPRRNHPQLIR
jgi:hypothetical protein